MEAGLRAASPTNITVSAEVVEKASKLAVAAYMWRARDVRSFLARVAAVLHGTTDGCHQAAHKGRAVLRPADSYIARPASCVLQVAGCKSVRW